MTPNPLSNNKHTSHSNPIWSPDNTQGGLRYLVRVEPNSNLSQQTANGQDIGANITTFKGLSGSMWGEGQAEIETAKPSWPFPFQETIATKMRAFTYTGPTWSTTDIKRPLQGNKSLSGNRGFAQQDTNLTHYVWGYMGSTVPPMNVQATAQGQTAVLRWDPQAPKAARKVKQYFIYDYDPKLKTTSNKRTLGLTNTARIQGLKKGQTYHFVVTVQEDGQAESGWSYPTGVTID